MAQFIQGLRPLPPTPADSRSFPFWDFRKMLLIFGFVQWDLGSASLCNRYEMAVGFQWTDSQLISNHVDSFSMVFLI